MAVFLLFISKLNPSVRCACREGGWCSFNFAEYSASPAAVVHSGLFNSSGQPPISSSVTMPLADWQSSTRSAMSHMPFSSAPPPVRMMPS